MMIFNQGWSVDVDGPGKRLVFYLKGCNFRCHWCASPESLSPSPQLMYYPSRASTPPAFACPHGAVSDQGLNRDICAKCADFACVHIWKNPCFERVGVELSPSDIVRKALTSRHLFGRDGGVTFGGGEPTLQIKELRQCIDMLVDESINVAVETNASTTGFQELLGKPILLISDFKAFSSGKHEKFTGVGNEQVLENLRLAAQKHENLLVRIPLVTGVNDSEEEMIAMIDFLNELMPEAGQGILLETLLEKAEFPCSFSKKSVIKSLKYPRKNGGLKLEILRQHHLGAPKYDALVMEYPMKNVAPPSEINVERFYALWNSKPPSTKVDGISCGKTFPKVLSAKAP